MKKLLYLLLVFTTVFCRRDLPVFEIKLDAPVHERYDAVMKHFNSSLSEVYHSLTDGVLGMLLTPLSLMRGPEEPELEEEIRYFANYTGLPYDGIHALQMFYEINSVMIPVVNFTGKV